jgi:ketosteroid isomerase-like protein
MKSLLATTCALSLALAAPGCGGSEEDAATEAVESYLEALRAGDPDAVCSLLTQAELDDLDVTSSCRDVYAAGFELLAEQGVEIPEYEISEVVVDGERAEATLTAAATDEAVPLAKEDGEWKLAGVTSIDEFHPDDPLP